VTASRWILIECNAKGCKQAFQPANTVFVHTARKLAEKSGWWTDHNRLDYCPQHKEYARAQLERLSRSDS